MSLFNPDYELEQLIVAIHNTELFIYAGRLS